MRFVSCVDVSSYAVSETPSGSYSLTNALASPSINLASISDPYYEFLSSHVLGSTSRAFISSLVKLVYVVLASTVKIKFLDPFLHSSDSFMSCIWFYLELFLATMTSIYLVAPSASFGLNAYLM